MDDRSTPAHDGEVHTSVERPPLDRPATSLGSASVSTPRSAFGVVVPGLLLALAGALLGALVHAWSAAVSPHVVAVLFGAVAANVGIVGPTLQPGLRTAGRRVLRIGIALVGFRLSLGEVFDLGPRALVAVGLVVAVTFSGTQWIGRRLGLSRPLSLLVATGYSICGASAIAAAEPFSDASDEEVAYSIALVTLCGSLAIFVLPPLGDLLRLNSEAFGAWVGASVHDVGQVVAAASTRDERAMKSSVIVKLTRVALLAPLLLGVAMAARRRRAAAQLDSAVAGEQPVHPPLLPLFVVMFLVAVIIRSTGVLSADALSLLGRAESLLISMGLVGLGAGVRIARLRTVGGRPLVLGLLSWVLVAAISYVAVTLAIV